MSANSYLETEAVVLIVNSGEIPALPDFCYY